VSYGKFLGVRMLFVFADKKINLDAQNGEKNTS
jgi:hypothetical protein